MKILLLLLLTGCSNLIIDNKDVVRAKCICNVYGAELVSIEHFHYDRTYYDVICIRDGVFLEDLGLPFEGKIYIEECDGNTL